MRFLVAIFFLSIINSLNAQQAIEFIENKGQWSSNFSHMGSIGSNNFAIKKDGGYRLQLNNAQDLEEISGYYHGHNHNHEAHPKNTKAIKNLFLRSHIYEVSFLNGNPNPEIISEKLVPGLINYLYGNDPNKWGTDCKVYQAITAKNIYPNIDIRYYTGNNSLKYDIVVKPGANPNKIALYIDGADKLKTKDGKLIIETSVNTITEPKPYTYQTRAIGRKEIECDFVVRGNIVTFNISNFDNKETLVIDPTLVFSTLTGSTADNWGYTATYDAAGSLYAGGIAFVGTNQNFPVSNGAYQTSYGGGQNEANLGGYDVALIKYNSTGTQRVYATYLGGSGNEQPHSLVVDVDGNLAISGRTFSTNFPTTAGRFGPTGGWDIFVTKLNANGNGLVGSLVVGGSGDDGVNVKTKTSDNGVPDNNSMSRNYGDDARSEILLDAFGNILVASCTHSLNFFTTSAFQSSNASTTNGRRQDAVFLRINPSVSNILVSSYLGGANDDAAFVLALNPSNNNIFIAGGTVSNNFPGDKSTAYQASFQGGACDGFVAELSSDGTNLIRSSYFGTSGAENIYGIQFDRFGFPYIMGTTTGNWPVQNALFSQTNGKQFIAKVQPNLSAFIYSTVFGTNNPSPNLSPSAFLVDRCENVYVSGWGGVVNNGYLNAGTIGLTVTPDAIKNTTDGSDVYFIVIEKNAARQIYGSFFGQNGTGNGSGGEHVDGGTSRFDRNGVIYQTLCANCGSAGISFPTFPSNVWSSNNGATANGGGCNMASFKIAFNLAGVGSDIQSSIRGVIKDTSGCVPLTVNFFDSLRQGTIYIWNFADGTGDFVSTAPNINHTFNAIGTYRVRLVSIDSSTCNIADTSYLTLRVREDIANLGLSATKLGGCESRAFQFTNTSTPPPGKPFRPNSFRIEFGDGASATLGGGSVTHSYAAFGTYNARLILIDTNYCNEPDTFPLVIRLIDNIDARFITPSSGCVPYRPNFQNTSLGGVTFTWQDGQGNVQSGTTPNFVYNTVGTYIVKMYAFDIASCNQLDSAETTIIVNPAPTAAFTMSPNPSTLNATTSFTNNSIGANNFKWVFGDGDSLITTQISPPIRHTYIVRDLFNPCLIAFNNFGCTDTICDFIQTDVSPLFDVPNSFTPNGDGINDRIFVKGFGIAKMEWTIYNRFGTVVFVSNSVKGGWDGTFKGVLQPQEVYNYTLRVQFGDGTIRTKTGDITLLK